MNTNIYINTSLYTYIGDDANPSMCGYNPDFPASSPYVLAVGATQGPEFGTYICIYKSTYICTYKSVDIFLNVYISECIY
jgi:subtilase family serine protease